MCSVFFGLVSAGACETLGRMVEQAPELEQADKDSNCSRLGSCVRCIYLKFHVPEKPRCAKVLWWVEVSVSRTPHWRSPAEVCSAVQQMHDCD